MIVRPLDLADTPAYRALMLQGYAQAADAFTSTAAERESASLDWWTQRLQHEAGLGLAFGAFVDERLMGSVAIEYSAQTKTRHKAHVVGMYVAPGHRRHGAGRALLAAALDHARQRPGISAVVLTVTEGNASATRLYEAAGFTIFGREARAIRTDTAAGPANTSAQYKSKLHMQLLIDPTLAGDPP